eukprot:INCI18319.1.p1 GENE.INCI18319.1~~INCI18319.1.p1  ORF type:complete len:341 (-),score=48.10 INCI18319.1:9-1031(-)
MKSAHMPTMNPNFQSRKFQPPGFKENRSTVSLDAPAWFKVHPSVKTRVTPHDPDAKTNITLYLKVTDDLIGPGGKRKPGTYAAGPRGIEDTAVSEKAPDWFHVSHVPKVDTPVTSFYDPFVPEHHEATVGTTQSEDMPDWAQLPSVPKKPPRVQRSEALWRHDYRPGTDTLRFDRDAATSKEAPDFFHIEGVPRAQGNAYGGYDFDYDHGAFGKNKKGFKQRPFEQPNAQQSHRGQAQSRGRTPKLPPATPSRAQSRNTRTRPLDARRVTNTIAAGRKREAAVLKLQREIKEQKQQNLRLLSEHIAAHETKLQQRLATQAGPRSAPTHASRTASRSTALW